MKKKSNSQYTESGIKYLETADIKYRKKLGQYFTPLSICNDTVSVLKKYIDKNKKIKVLEPSAGAGEFIQVVKDNFLNAEIKAFEIDKNLCNILSSNYKDVKIENVDTITKIPEIKYDLVIGNPPYFETKLDSKTKERFKDIIKGRVNIFSLFIKIGLEYLKDGGYLAYVLPSSLKSGHYFSAIREYILNNSSIEYMETVKNNYSFHSANQSVIILILKKNGRNKDKYVFRRDSITVFSEDYKKIKDFYKDKLSLKEIGYDVKTGSIVWNQNKKILTDTKDGNSKMLIKSSNIGSSKIVYDKKSKYPQYIKTTLKDKSPAIVVNRIVGSVNNASIRYAIVSSDIDYVGENHINIIYLKDNKKNNHYTLEYIKKNMDNKNNIKIMLSITGNTQISRKELLLLLPIE